MTDWPYLLLLVLISPAVGSFVAVLVDRLPEGRSILNPSCCANCSTALRWREMIPILSALALRHRCAHCGAPIPGHLIRLEVAAVVAGLVALSQALPVPQTWLFASVLWCLVGLFYADLLHYRLPDPLVAALFALGLVLAWTDPARDPVQALLSAFIGFAVFWGIARGYALIRGREGMGFGDVKLFGAIGALVGWEMLPVVALIAAGMGLVVALLDMRRFGAAHVVGTPQPFGSYLSGASALILMMT